MSFTPKIWDTKPCLIELEAGQHLWCSCGLSGHQPLCDFSHKGTGCFPTRFFLPERQTIRLCNCKQTRNPPYCDGSHTQLQSAQEIPPPET